MKRRKARLDIGERSTVHGPRSSKIGGCEFGARRTDSVVWVSVVVSAVCIALATVGCGMSVDRDAGQSVVEGAGEDPGVDRRDDEGVGADSDDQSVDPDLPYAAGVVEFLPGDGAGTGQEKMPDIVLGPPEGEGPNKGSLDVVSLGTGGEIVVEFGDRVIVDEDGADFIVFENPFFVQGDPEQVFEELGEVSVSADGESWETFECDTEPAEPGRWPGCAGWRPVEDYEPEETLPPEPAVTGGDPFDLADVGLEKVRYVRIRDVSGQGSAPSAGFDLDAVGIVHGRVDGTSR